MPEMCILSFGDIHMSLRGIVRLASQLRAADLVVLSGDLTNFGGPEEARQVVESTQRYARAVLALPGNLDRPEVMEFLQARHVCLHGAGRRFGTVGIFGCGGSNSTPFHTPMEFTEAELRAALDRGYAQIAGAAHALMVCHTPPLGTATDRIASGQHVGSAEVRAFIEAHQPEVCITGHIHESPGIDHIGRTTVVNAGAFHAGGYIVVSLGPDGLTAELKRLEG